jgi:hypothetical protein
MYFRSMEKELNNLQREAKNYLDSMRSESYKRYESTIRNVADPDPVPP